MIDYEKAIELKPFQDAHLNDSIVLFMLGKFERGWEEKEWRCTAESWRTPHSRNGSRTAAPFPIGLWLHTEQGSGDAIIS